MSVSRPYLITELAGAVACWGVRQSPYDEGPANLTQVLKEFTDSLKTQMKPLMGTYYIELPAGVEAMDAFLRKHLEPILAFRQWNLTKYEMDQGITDPEDPNRLGGFGFTSRHGGPKPDLDFIDLDAFFNNVTGELVEEAEMSHQRHCAESGQEYVPPLRASQENSAESSDQADSGGA